MCEDKALAMPQESIWRAHWLGRVALYESVNHVLLLLLDFHLISAKRNMSLNLLG